MSKRLTQRDEFGNANIIELDDIMPELYEGLSFSETNALTDALNKLADYEDEEELGLNKRSLTFKNDPFALVLFVHEKLHPGKEPKAIYWVTEFKDEEGNDVFGATEFDDETHEPTVLINAGISVVDAVEILAHELAHIAVGIEADHGEEWEKAFDNIFKEYNSIAEKATKKNKAEVSGDE